MDDATKERQLRIRRIKLDEEQKRLESLQRDQASARTTKMETLTAQVTAHEQTIAAQAEEYDKLEKEEMANLEKLKTQLHPSAVGGPIFCPVICEVFSVERAPIKERDNAIQDRDNAIQEKENIIQEHSDVRELLSSAQLEVKRLLQENKILTSRLPSHQRENRGRLHSRISSVSRSPSQDFTSFGKKPHHREHRNQSYSRVRHPPPLPAYADSRQANPAPRPPYGVGAQHEQGVRQLLPFHDANKGSWDHTVGQYCQESGRPLSELIRPPTSMWAPAPAKWKRDLRKPHVFEKDIIAAKILVAARSGQNRRKHYCPGCRKR